MEQNVVFGDPDLDEVSTSHVERTKLLAPTRFKTTQLLSAMFGGFG
jgi:hypothetical protein